jgi:hypothetical protein
MPLANTQNLPSTSDGRTKKKEKAKAAATPKRSVTAIIGLNHVTGRSIAYAAVQVCLPFYIAILLIYGSTALPSLINTIGRRVMDHLTTPSSTTTLSITSSSPRARSPNWKLPNC